MTTRPSRTSDFTGKHLGKDPYVALVHASTEAAEDGRPIPSDLSPPLLGLRQDTAPLGDCDYRTGTRALCANGDPDSDKTIVLVGDSHARAWSPAFDRAREAAGLPPPTTWSSAAARRRGRSRPSRRTCARGPTARTSRTGSSRPSAQLHPDLVVVATSAVSPDGGAGRRPGRRPRRPRGVPSHWFADGVLPGAAELKPLDRPPRRARQHSQAAARAGRLHVARVASTLKDCLFKRGPVDARDPDGLQARPPQEQDVAFVNALPWFCYRLMGPPVIGEHHRDARQRARHSGVRREAGRTFGRSAASDLELCERGKKATITGV